MKCFASTSVVATTLMLHLVGGGYAFVGSTGRLFHSFSTTTTRNTDSSSTSRLFVEPLAQEGDWAAYLDEENTGLVYYFNGATGESLWVPPTPTFPLVSLNPNQSKVAQAKQREYQAGAVSATTQKSTTTVTATSAAAQEDTSQKTVKEASGGGPFGFFNKRKKEEDASESVTPVDTPSVETKKRRFGLGVIKSVLTRSNQDDDANGTAAPATTKAVVADAAVVKTSPVTTPTTIDTSPSVLEVDVAAYVLPHPAKVRWGGEDAVFIKGRNFGVFDGVSGAEKLDGVPLYSLTLANEMKALVKKDEVLSFPQMTKILTEAAQYADKAATGASTAVVGSLSEDGDLTVLNLGDSLCVVVRDGKIVAKTKEIVHYFDCPYQLSEDSPDRPKDGTRLTIKVQKGDFIIMGSDGIFDNLKDTEICDLCLSNGKFRAATITRKIVEQSRRVSLDSNADTPYAKLAMRNRDPDYSNGLGGKVDDASCIVVKCS